VSDVTVQVTDDPIIVSISNSPGPAGASSFFKGLATAWPPSATPTAGWIYTLPDPVPTGTPAGFLAGYGAQWDGAAWTNIGPVRGPAGPAGPQGVAGAAGSPGAAGAQGPQGNTGPAGSAGAQGPSGPAGTNGTNGTNGTAATITVGSVTTGAAGTSASVVNAGTSSAATLNFTIPRGDAGAAGAAGAAGPQGPAGSAGAAGAAATVSVGSVSTGAAGSSATVTNVGTTSAAVLNFSIPQGAAGAAGAAGSTGPAGSSGVISVTAPLTNSGTSSAAVLALLIGSGLSVSGGALVATGYTLPTATASVLGGIKIGSGLTIDGSGVVTAAGTYTLPAATISALGGVIVGTGLAVSSGTISVSYGTSSSTACVGNDSRLSDARTPTAHTQAWSTITATPTTLGGYGITDAATSTHTHGNITNAGTIGSTSGQIVVTTTSGVLTTVATISAATQVSGLAAVATSGSYSDLSGKPTTFAPAAHGSTHQTGGADAVAAVVVTPTSLAADTNDWSIGTGDIFRVAGTAARNITGIAAGTSGLAILLVNVGSFALTLKHQSASSTAANRFTVPWAGDCVLAASGGAVVLVYDSTSSTWRVV
jgi:hypothetical protein